MPRLSRLSLLLVAVPLALGACKKKAPVVGPTPVSGGGGTTPVQPRVEPPPPERAMNNGSSGTMSPEQIRTLMLETVYFEYNSDVIRSDAQSSLEKRVPLLRANPQVKLRVAGNCDDRGTDEYNIALGSRRADAVKKFLTDRGIDASRIETISFGRERPAVQGDNEDAWSKNRRDEFTITSGGDNLKSPS